MIEEEFMMQNYRSFSKEAGRGAGASPLEVKREAGASPLEDE
jgi:hypothetical protein